MEYTYLFLNIGSLIVPLIFSFHPKLLFYKKWNSFFPSLLIVAFSFIIWDIYFTSIGIWGFNEAYLTGFYIFNLPIEEVLFFICIPYASVYTYHCFQIFFQIDKPKLTKFISLFILILLASVLVLNYTKWYTGVTFCLTFLLMVYTFFKNPKWLGVFYLSFSVILIPFLLVNGLLTGMFFDKPVVWYNDLENLGIRIISIPIEDTVYALLMLLSTTFIFEKRKLLSN